MPAASASLKSNAFAKTRSLLSYLLPFCLRRQVGPTMKARIKRTQEDNFVVNVNLP